MKNSRKRGRAAKKANYRRLAKAMNPGRKDEDPLESAAGRTLLRQTGAKLEKRGDKFVIVSPPKQPIK